MGNCSGSVTDEWEEGVEELRRSVVHQGHELMRNVPGAKFSVVLVELRDDGTERRRRDLFPGPPVLVTVKGPGYAEAAAAGGLTGRHASLHAAQVVLDVLKKRDYALWSRVSMWSYGIGYSSGGSISVIEPIGEVVPTA